MFFNQVQLHGELADLAFKRRNVGLVLGNDAGLSLLIVQIAAIELRLACCRFLGHRVKVFPMKLERMDRKLFPRPNISYDDG